jgi:hypothetical protein
MSAPLFPQLLEIFRCDTLATFSSPEPYYRACRLYRRYQARSGCPPHLLAAAGSGASIQAAQEGFQVIQMGPQRGRWPGRTQPPKRR